MSILLLHHSLESKISGSFSAPPQSLFPFQLSCHFFPPENFLGKIRKPSRVFYFLKKPFTPPASFLAPYPRVLFAWLAGGGKVPRYWLQGRFSRRVGPSGSKNPSSACIFGAVWGNHLRCAQQPSPHPITHASTLHWPPGSAAVENGPSVTMQGLGAKAPIIDGIAGGDERWFGCKLWLHIFRIHMCRFTFIYYCFLFLFLIIIIVCVVVDDVSMFYTSYIIIYYYTLHTIYHILYTMYFVLYNIYMRFCVKNNI